MLKKKSKIYLVKYSFFFLHYETSFTLQECQIFKNKIALPSIRNNTDIIRNVIFS